MTGRIFFVDGSPTFAVTKLQSTKGLTHAKKANKKPPLRRNEAAV